MTTTALRAAARAGAYQETMGSIHNLFSSLNTVLVDWDQDKKKFKVKPHKVPGETVKQVLKHVHHDADSMLEG